MNFVEAGDIRPSSSTSYSEVFPSGAGIDKIPRGAVRQKLKLFGGSFSHGRCGEINVRHSASLSKEPVDYFLESKKFSTKISIKRLPQNTMQRYQSGSTSSLRLPSDKIGSSRVRLQNAQATLTVKRNETPNRLKKIKTSVDGRHTFKKPVTYASAGHLILVSTLVMVSREEASGCIDAAFKNFCGERVELVEPGTNRTSQPFETKYNESFSEKSVVRIDGPIYQQPVIQRSPQETVASSSLYANELSKSSTWAGSRKPEVIYDQPFTGTENAKTIQVPLAPISPRILVAQLASFKELNQQLAVKLAKAERDAQLFRLQLSLLNENNEAEVEGRNDVETLREEALEALLKEQEGNGLRPLSPASIRKNCDRMLQFVKEYGCSMEYKKENRTPEVSFLAALEECSIPGHVEQHDAVRGNGICNEPEDGRSIGYKQSYNPAQQISALQGKLTLLENELSMKDDEIDRLERGIADAQRCVYSVCKSFFLLCKTVLELQNQQLNAKLGMLSMGNTVERRVQDKELSVG
ncbi:unnamed protein product [Enterobius vermicularis]|uniref:Protein kinase domain-containing protein n=1 Tax=Enterobius vermicularis TaxID=51028 RepID=A0A0N4UWN6_ENTVE|nr:unnamed protein product [Enterobius vermicularis]